MRDLGAFEHLYWLYNQFNPMDFATVAKLYGQFSCDQLAMALRQVQQRHPLLRVRIATDATGQPKFVETDGEIPIRWVARTDAQHWQQELEVELSCSVDWQVAPLLRVVLLQSGGSINLNKTGQPSNYNTSTRNEISLIQGCPVMSRSVLGAESELIIVCHHVIADGLSGVYLVRDILQALDGKQFERTDLSTVLSLESALTGIVPYAEATAKPIDYLPSLSHRPRPHVRSIVLSTEITQQLIHRSRAEGTTVHGAISAAFLFALIQQDLKPRDAMGCLHPVNVRPQLSLPILNGVGLYICLCMTSHSLSVDSAFWDVARLVKSQLPQIDMAQRLVEECQLRQATMAHLTDAATFVKDLQSQYPCQLTVTNLGRLELAQQYGNIRVEALHAPAVMTDGRIVGAATLGDRLALTLSLAPLMDIDRAQSDRAATAFLSEGVKCLERAVVQDVMLKDP